eukprot:scaffold982_cov169-Amphora_coffeaeformis.AAC.7
MVSAVGELIFGLMWVLCVLRTCRDLCRCGRMMCEKMRTASSVGKKRRGDTDRRGAEEGFPEDPYD